MKTYKEIQDQINIDFDNYLSDLLNIDGEPRKYFYWSFNFFKTVDNLSFQYFSLTNEQKDEINKIGVSYFNSEITYFQINKNSHRHDLLIKNINKLFANSSASKQSNRYEYLKEFILWQILIEVKENLLKNIKRSEKSNSDDITKLKIGLKDISDVIEKQKKNYLITYITFLIQNTDNPTFNAFKDYIKYNLTNRGEELIKKLDELDREYIYDSKTKKEIKRTIHNLNSNLRKKIENLYVLKEAEPKIQFVFSRNGGGGKEELRELLDIMGKVETGKLYRGQANSFWNLDASITREPKYLENEENMYYDILSLKPDAFRNDTTVYERLITMQHYGMPTRLLDVTRNPLVAIFFACNNLQRKDSDGVIFIFKPEKSIFLNFADNRLRALKVLFGIEDDKQIKEPREFLSDIWFLKGVAKNQRINNQSGDFIFAGNGDEAKQKLHQLPKMSIIIDSKTKEVLIQQLASLNIHGGAVYPDLTHMSNYISEKYKNETSPLKQPVSRTAKSRRTKFPKKADKIKSDKELIPSFDFKKIKNKDKNVQLNSFAKSYNLYKTQLEKLVDDINFTGKSPLRDEIASAMKEKPALKERANVLKALSDRIITLAKIVGEE